MFPIGVFVHPGPEPAPVSFKDPFAQKGATGSRWKRVQRAFERPRHPSATSITTSDNDEPEILDVLERQPRPAILAPRRASSPPPPKARQKHIPIVIPRYVPLLSQDAGLYSPEPSPSAGYSFGTISSSSSISDFPLPLRQASASFSANTSRPTSRPRHVEILIPAWAQPVQTLPPSPPTTVASGSSSPTAVRLSAGRASGASLAPSMSKQTPNTSRSNTLDSNVSAPSPGQLYRNGFKGSSTSLGNLPNGSSTSLYKTTSQEPGSQDTMTTGRQPPGSSTLGGGPSPAVASTAGLGSSNPVSGLASLICNVHRTTGREPRSLVGATTTILGDKLYVFGGRRLSRSRPALTSDIYELDLLFRHWTKLDVKGDIPPPRYFHSVCALGDTKLVCYGGMSPSVLPSGQPNLAQTSSPSDPQPEVVVMSDIHIFDVTTKTWMHVPVAEAPQGRYAHCASILPSSAVFTSASAPLSAVHMNPSSANNPNQGSIGVSLDGHGGAEMIVVGGQDSSNHYIEQISVFNLRSLRWTSTAPLGKSCGAYRSVVAPIPFATAAKIGSGTILGSEPQQEAQQGDETGEGGSAMLIYSNYNFLDVKLELQIRYPDGTLSEKPMHGTYSPPGLRFPNGGVTDNHFVVSGTFLTSTRQEYALWALDLRTLTWSRIDVGGTTFTQGSWNRGLLWKRRNMFAILGNRKRSLVEDYNHRRINFTNICLVELEAAGLYNNPRRLSPMSGYTSISSPGILGKADPYGGGRQLCPAAEDLGTMALGLRELADMDFLATGGERIPVNSHLVARRWGPYFNQLLREGTQVDSAGTDTATLRPAPTNSSRMSSVTITPSVKSSYSNATTLTANESSSTASTANGNIGLRTSSNPSGRPGSLFQPPPPNNPMPATRPRTLYLPHTHLTLQALVHFLYTSSLPPPSSRLCTPQILCSLLQFARPYRVDGLLEATVERLHQVLDGRNTAAIFNAAAMAAGGGEGLCWFDFGDRGRGPAAAAGARALSKSRNTGPANPESDTEGATSAGPRGLRIDTDVAGGEEEVESASTETSTSVSDLSSLGREGGDEEKEIWTGSLSAVVGLQKRGLRGLMEGRRNREMGKAEGSFGQVAAATAAGTGGGGEGRVGLGIAAGMG